jgi:adenosine deaminase
MPSRGLAELHIHQYGDIAWQDFLAHLSAARCREIDWTYYESQFADAYGTPSGVVDILARHHDGDVRASELFRELFVFGDPDAGNFARFQAKFNLLISGSVFLRLHAVANPVAALSDELCGFLSAIAARQRQQGIGYVERRSLMDFDVERCHGVYTALLAAHERESTPDFTARMAISLPRHDPWPQWEMVKQLALGPSGEFLTGIDFCFLEEGFPPKDKAEFFRAVHEFNDRHPERALAILYHVGESFQDKSLESAIRWVQESAELGAHRLGHAIALGVDPAAFGAHERRETVAERRDQLRYDEKHAEGLRRHGVRIDLTTLSRERAGLVDRPGDSRLAIRYDEARLAEVRARQDYAMKCVRDTGAVIEVCPTSNRRIGDIEDAAHHPVHRFLANDLLFAVASDDPGIFDTTLEREIDWVAQQAQLETDQAEELGQRAWQYRSEVLTGRAPA